MNPHKAVIRGLTFEPDGSIAIDYMIPAEDVRTNGLVSNHALLVPAGSDYDDELEAVTTAVFDLLEDALDDLDRVPATDFTKPAPADDDEEEDDE